MFWSIMFIMFSVWNTCNITYWTCISNPKPNGSKLTILFGTTNISNNNYHHPLGTSAYNMEERCNNNGTIGLKTRITWCLYHLHRALYMLTCLLAKLSCMSTKKNIRVRSCMVSTTITLTSFYKNEGYKYNPCKIQIS